MTSSFTISLRLLYSINLLISISHVSEAAPNPIDNYCPGTKPFLPNSTYQKNLNNLLSSLSSAADSAGDNISSSGRFTNATAGQDPPDQAYGIFLCRGDIDAATCSDCIATAAKDIIRQCPGEKTSIIWYDTCMLRYSNQPIYSVMRQAPVSIKVNGLNITDDRSRFVQLLGQTLDYVVRTAPSIRSGKKVAAAEAELASSQRLYTLAECTPDLTASDCGACLRSAIAGLPQGTPGGRVLTPSCNVRFEVYPFYNAAALVNVATVGTPPPVQLPSAPAPATGPKGGKSNSTTTVIIAVSASVSAALVISVLVLLIAKRKKQQPRQRDEGEVGDEISMVESLQFDFSTIEAATDNFSYSKKLGQGGFGAVYMGRLFNGQDIAVKRLSRSSGQGEVEFKNEVMLLARLQHRNLVRLLGFCLEGVERLLIYEFLPNSSLDKIIIDPLKRVTLNWNRRHKIIMGVARGLLYLHEDSRLRIIHRDLKASNILLDSDLNPKISDFGTARLFELDQTQANTNQIIGTYGYMAPEYAMHGNFSVKSDVFSFGVLVLEIVSGQRNNLYRMGNETEVLISYVWKNWMEGSISNIIDPSITSGSSIEIARCIHIGLLCVQENAASRPTISAVLLMLNSHLVTRQVPSRPAFFMCSGIESDMSLTQDYNSRAFEVKKSRSKSSQFSKNEASMSEPYPQ